MTSCLITSWQIDGETMTDFIFLGSKITVDDDFSHEIKRHLLVGMTSLVAQTVKCLPTMRETWFRFLGREDPLEKEMATHSSLFPEKSHEWRSLVGYSPWGHKESDTTE